MAGSSWYAKTKAFVMRHAGPKTWIFALFKDNLGPKIGTGFAVYQLASILLKGMADATVARAGAASSMPNIMNQEASALVGMLAPMKSLPLFWALIGFCGIWVLALMARGAFQVSKIKSEKLFKFGQYGRFASIPAQFVMGMLVVPMVLTATLMLIAPQAFSLDERIVFWKLAFIFVILVVGMHYFSFIEKELPNTVIYTISTPNTMQQPVGQNIVEMFEKALAGLVWVGTPDYSSASDDGRIVISLPILYRADHWKKDEASQLGTRLHKAEQELHDGGCMVLSRTVPDGIERRMPLELRKPYSLWKKPD